MSVIFSDITILGPDGNAEPHKFVGIRGGTICHIGDAKPDGSWEREIDGRSLLLMPAFYNSHAHSPMTLMRGYGENLALHDWLNTRIFPFEDKLYPEAVYYGTLLAMAESFRSGIVSSSDMYFFTDDMVRAVCESGAKANIARSLAGFDEAQDMREMDSFKEAKRAFEQYHGAEGGRIIIDMSLHMEETSTERLARQLAEYTREIGARMQVHVSETKREHEGCKERHGGLTPTAYLNGLGLFDSPTTAAHCVWVEDEDIGILREKGVTVASCPVSNLKLASGVCDTPRLIGEGIGVALGTDSAASNNSLDFFGEMKLFALVNKERRGDPTLITPEQAFYAATRAGALGQGREDCGLVKEGYRADLVALDLAAPSMHPMFDPVGNIVYSASPCDVALTMVDGTVVYEGGEYPTIDIERAVYETDRACEDICARLG
ncbi:MAG: amidohydrolase [Clostridiales Family XIII bacterium]|jgi:5-methylthioadenosine/S-adenosylhomocysteine deaminase|nr:amidohydrolase [Clostridiales Family XIII bacterium]